MRLDAEAVQACRAPMQRSLLKPACLLPLVVVAVLMAGCAGVSLGIGLPIGGLGGVGVSVDSDGRVGGKVGAGRGGVTVGVGGSAQIPTPSERAASAPRQ